MDEFEKWQESDEHSAIRIRAARCEVGGMDSYGRAAFKAGREAGMREAAWICERWSGVGDTQVAQPLAKAILSAIGGDK